MSQPYSYRPRMNRNVTRKWAEARQVDYDGDEWGADPYGEEDNEPMQPAFSQSGRSFTNPSQLNTKHRLSFDQGAEQRVFSAGAAGIEPTFSTAAQPPSSQFLPSQSSASQAQPLSRAPASTASTSFDSQGRDVPLEASGASTTTARAFPPRKSSLGQSNAPDFDAAQQIRQREPIALTGDAKPLPFIRPADIYKRMEEEKEKERRSQESGRPSFDSLQRGATENTPKPSIDESSKPRQPTLNTVAERKSEYGTEGLIPPSEAPEQSVRHDNPSQINTDVTQGQNIPSASSRYTDRPDSIATDSQFPSRSVSQHDSKILTRPGFLPELSRTSTFGPDFFHGSSAGGDGPATQQQAAQPPPRSMEDISLKSNSTSNGPYRTIVDNAFQSENNTTGSPAQTEDSLLRSNTTSTSQISPIVGRSNEQEWNTDLARSVERSPSNERKSSADQIVEDLGAPRRIGTHRRDSPSPARRPLSVAAPPVSEPLSALINPAGEGSLKDTATETQIVRPGPAILVHQRKTSDDALPKSKILGSTAAPGTNPSLRKQESLLSEASDPSNLRTASDEWRDWSNARKEFNAKHGFKDSNPTTPGYESPGVSSPTPTFDSLDRNVTTSTTGKSGDSTHNASSNASLPKSTRPAAARDESFRPSLPGGWQSSTSIQKAPAADVASMNPPRSDAASSVTRSDSAESIPTAGAPRRADWRSEYTGPQAQAFAAAATAGSALAGIFSGSALTSRGGDSEVSSIDEHDDDPTGRSHDASLIHRDFASPTPPPPAVPDRYATRDFANSTPPTQDTSMNTPKASQQPFVSAIKPEPLTSSRVEAPLVGRSSLDSTRADSPSKESERWWSDDEDAGTAAHAPAPLRTNRLSTIEPGERKSPSFSNPGRHRSPNREQLESDIVKSLTPKSSGLDKTETQDLTYGPRLSPTRTNEDRSGSPPFSAAALAVSPARDYGKLQEQNTFKPLSAPSSQPQSPSPMKVPGRGQLDQLGSDHAKSTRFTIGEQSNRNTQPEARSRGVDLTLNEPKGDAGNAPQFSKPARAATKEFSIVPDTFIGPTTASSVADKRTPGQSTSVGPPEMTRPYPTTLPEESAPAPLRGQHPLKAATMQAHATPSETATASSIAPSKAMTIDGSTKPLPQPVSADDSKLNKPSTPTSISQASGSAHSPTLPLPGKMNENTPYDVNRSFPTDKVPIEQIFGMGGAQQRINAYNDNREAYAQPVGHLENWLSHMKTTEHADAFTPLPLTKTDYATPSPRSRRDDSTPSGTKLMQEDGKRLLASASKYGVKAGVLGKGLFSKGKEKLRTVSASQKGGLTTRKNANVSDNSRSVSSNSVPQIPTPIMGTPVDDSSFSAYFPPRDSHTAPILGPKAAVAPPFSPISEVSTTQNELGRPMSAVSDEDVARTNPLDRPTNYAAPPNKPTPALENDKRKSAGAVSTLDSDRSDRRVSTDLLNPTEAIQERRNSSVSDVSSFSDSPNRRQNLAARTISPPIEHQISRDDPPSGPVPPVTQVFSGPNEKVGGQHAPSYSTAMASKEAEAMRDRAESQGLPEYSQPAQPKATKMDPGAQIVPIARLRQDQQVRPEEPRPFSFVGSESLLHTGHGTNHSIDNPGVNIVPPASSIRDRGTNEQSADASIPGAIKQPAHMASRASETQEDPYRPSRIQTQAQAEEQYRIPGPYGHELRSPRPKNSSPMLEQFRSPVAPHTPGETVASGSAQQRAVTSDYTPFPPQQNAQQSHQSDRQEQGPAPPAFHQQRSYVDTTFGADRDRERSRDRGRSSKFSALFRSRSKSRSRRLQKERSRTNDQRPENNRRNSLFKLGARNSMSRENSYNDAQGADQDNMSDSNAQDRARPVAGPRRLSKDLLKGSNFNKSEKSQGQYDQQDYVAGNKKKRFSGLFGKSPARYEHYQSEAPTRNSNVPDNSYQTYVSSRNSDFHDQSPLPLGGTERNAQETHIYGQTIPSQTHAQPSQFLQRDGTAEQQLYGPQVDQHDPHIGGTFAQQSHRNEQPDQYSLYSNTSFQKPRQSTSPYTHDNRPNPYESASQHQYEQPRPVLPRLNTGDNRSANATPVPASAPAVPSSYLQARQNQSIAPVQTHTLPQEPSHQQYHQISFPQPPSLAQYHQPPTTRAAKDISYNSNVHDRKLAPFGDATRHDGFGDRQVTSPLPLSPPFSESDTLTDPMAGPSYPHQDAQFQPTPLYPQTQVVQPASRITPRVAQLHTRSRSPKLGRRSSEDLAHEFETANQNLAVTQPHSASSLSPVAGLGTFSSKKVSPIGGMPRSSEEQEKPWAITLPADEEERRRREGDPESATSSKAREMKRILLERSPVTTPVAVPQNQSPAGQTVADRFVSHGIPSQPIKSHEYQPPLPGSQKVLPTSRTSSRTSTPIIIGRPTTPSVTIRRDASLRGKGPQGRKSTVIDEAGRVMAVGGGPQRQDTPLSAVGQTSGRTSLDNNRDSNLSLSSKIQSQRDANTPVTHSTAPTARNTSTPPPPVPKLTILPGMTKSQTAVAPSTSAQHEEPSKTGSVPAETSAVATASARNSAPLDSNANPLTEGTATSTNLRDSPTNVRQGKASEVYEMAGSRPEGYESDEEPMMSATAYPGQEWQPVFDRWED